MNSLNILMLGGARRVSMARKFKVAGKRVKHTVNLFSYELTDDVAIVAEARVIIGKRWSDADILDDLKSVIDRFKIDIVIPFVDGACEVAARLAEEGYYSPVCKPELCVTLFDKVLADELYSYTGIPVPMRSVNPGDFFPVIAKPRKGSASKGVIVLRSAEELASISDDIDNYILQEYIENREEYTVDCFISVDGVAYAVVPRRRVEVLGGEVTRTVTVEYPELYSAACQVIERLHLSGAVTLQFLYDRYSERLMLMEINPRLGGGAVCAVQAGANIPLMILREYFGLENERAKWLAGVEIARYWGEVVVAKGSRWLPDEEDYNQSEAES